jgi:hypothetical protein
MSDLSLLEGDFPITAEYLTPLLLDMPQAPAPIYHRFGPGIYIREMHAAAGTLIVGHIQKEDHSNLLLKGKALMINEDESSYELEAPAFVVGKAGSRKIALVIEDMVWQNIYATDETDIDKLEERFLEPDKVKSVFLQAEFDKQEQENQHIRDDYKKMLVEFGMTEEQAKEYHIHDEVVDFDMPNQLRVAESAIEGLGLFTTAPILIGEYICKVRIGGKRTPAGRFTNHSPTPNCARVLLDNGDLGLVSLTNIDGCLGGSVGTELTVNYRNTPLHYKQLQEN